jgi:hypothetical protein
MIMARRKKNPKFPDFYKAKGSVFAAYYEGIDFNWGYNAEKNMPFLIAAIDDNITDEFYGKIAVLIAINEWGLDGFGIIPEEHIEAIEAYTTDIAFE